MGRRTDPELLDVCPTLMVLTRPRPWRRLDSQLCPSCVFCAHGHRWPSHRSATEKGEQAHWGKGGTPCVGGQWHRSPLPFFCSPWVFGKGQRFLAGSFLLCDHPLGTKGGSGGNGPDFVRPPWKPGTCLPRHRPHLGTEPPPHRAAPASEASPAGWCCGPSKCVSTWSPSEALRAAWTQQGDGWVRPGPLHVGSSVLPNQQLAVVTLSDQF